MSKPSSSISQALLSDQQAQMQELLQYLHQNCQIPLQHNQTQQQHSVNGYNADAFAQSAIPSQGATLISQLVSYLPLNQHNAALGSLPPNLAVMSGDSITTPTPTPGNTAKKVARFTAQQLALLNETFSKKRYIDHNMRQKLAIKLGVSEKKVGCWFADKRKTTKAAKLEKKGETAYLETPLDYLNRTVFKTNENTSSPLVKSTIHLLTEMEKKFSGSSPVTMKEIQMFSMNLRLTAGDINRWFVERKHNFNVVTEKEKKCKSFEENNTKENRKTPE